MSELVAVLIWVSIAVVGFAAGLFALGVTRRRLAVAAPAASSPVAVARDAERDTHPVAA